MSITVEDVRRVNYWRDELRDLEARLEATPPGSPGREALAAEVFEKRGRWRRAEEMLGRRTAGTAIKIDELVMRPIVHELQRLGVFRGNTRR